MVISFIPSFQEYKTLQHLQQTFILCFAVYCSLCRYIFHIKKTFIYTVLGLGHCGSAVSSVGPSAGRKVIHTKSLAWLASPGPLLSDQGWMGSPASKEGMDPRVRET